MARTSKRTLRVRHLNIVLKPLPEDQLKRIEAINYKRGRAHGLTPQQARNVARKIVRYWRRSHIW